MNQLKAKQFISALFEKATTVAHLDIIVQEIKELSKEGNLYFYSPKNEIILCNQIWRF